MNPLSNLRRQPPGNKTYKYRFFAFNSIFRNILRIGGSVLILMLTSSQLFSAVNVKNQDDLQVEGLVTNVDGEALPGVNILVEGTTTGTVTDIDGNYTINAPEEGTLVFSFIGYVSQKVPIDSRTTINVTLQET